MPQPSYDFMPQPSGGLPYGPQPTIGFEVNIRELLMGLVKEDSKMVLSLLKSFRNLSFISKTRTFKNLLSVRVLLHW